MEAIHVTIDTRQITVYEEECAKQAAGGGAGLRRAVIPRRTKPENRLGKILKFPSGAAAGGWEPEEDPDQEETSAGTRKTPGRLFQVLDLLATMAVLGAAAAAALVFLFG